MRRLLLPLAASALAVVLLAPSAGARVRITLRYLAIQTSSRNIDNPPKGPGPGDAFDFREHLVVPRGVAGSDHVRCTILSRTRSFCRGHAYFREGSIAFRGTLRFNRKTNVIAVTGGTGLFRGQRGSVFVRDAPHNNTFIRLVLR